MYHLLLFYFLLAFFLSLNTLVFLITFVICIGVQINHRRQC